MIGKKVNRSFSRVKEFGLFDILLKVYEDGKPRELGYKTHKDEKVNGWRYNSVRKLPSGELIVFYKDVNEHNLKMRYHLDEETQEHLKVHLLAKALEQTDDMVLITDANGIIEYVNDAVLAKTGYDKK